MEQIEKQEERRYGQLINNIGQLMKSARAKAAREVNSILVDTYWQIGRYIVEYEQGGKEKAVYGSQLLSNLSHDLKIRVGKGFSRSNLTYMRKFYVAFPNRETVSHKLTWSHYFEILKVDDPLAISFYTNECEKERWSVRELKRQIDSMLFHRLAVSKNKDQVLELASRGIDMHKPDNVIKDPYVLEFLGLSVDFAYKEGELEEALVNHIGRFLLELGKGFAYIGRQYRFRNVIVVRTVTRAATTLMSIVCRTSAGCSSNVSRSAATCQTTCCHVPNNLLPRAEQRG